MVGKTGSTLSAFERAIKWLELRPHFRREIELKLRRAGFEAAEIAETCDRLAKLGYLDDAVQARNHAATLAKRKGFGAARIRQELMRRGAPRESLDAALEGTGGEAEEVRAREAARRWSRVRAVTPAVHDALARHLARKGFDRRVIFTIIKELASDGGESTGEAFADD